MSGRVLLDTNIIIGIFANNLSLINSLAEANQVFVHSIALGELYYGAQRSNHVEENIERINEFADNSSIIL